MVRLRLWHTPEGGRDGLGDVLLAAKRVNLHGLDLLLDIHYSDFWADPGKQNKPAAWADLNFTALRDSVRTYTRSVVQALVNQGTTPSIVQIGNETTNGFLWDHGRVGGAFESPSQWSRYATLTNAAIAGVRDAAGNEPQIMIHIDSGGNASTSSWFFDNLFSFQVPIDIIGLSFYSFWHGSLSEMENTLSVVAERYGIPIMLAEVAYPWTLSGFDTESNFVWQESQLHEGFPASPSGQKDFLDAVVEIVGAIPSSLGHGVCYWAPDWIGLPGYTSVWENMALFDEHGEILPASSSLNPQIGVAVDSEVHTDQKTYSYPNPVSPTSPLTIEHDLTPPVEISVSNVLGQRIISEWSTELFNLVLSTSKLNRGVYYYSIVSNTNGKRVFGSIVVR